VKRFFIRLAHSLIDLAWIPVLLAVLALVILRGALPLRASADPFPRITR
jgi:hypothetical protein